MDAGDEIWHFHGVIDKILLKVINILMNIGKKNKQRPGFLSWATEGMLVLFLQSGIRPRGRSWGRGWWAQRRWVGGPSQWGYQDNWMCESGAHARDFQIRDKTYVISTQMIIEAMGVIGRSEKNRMYLTGIPCCRSTHRKKNTEGDWEENRRKEIEGRWRKSSGTETRSKSIL